MHIGFLCLIVLGRLWRKRELLNEYSRRYNRAHPGIRHACNANSRLRNLAKERKRVSVWVKSNRKRARENNRLSAKRMVVSVSSSYVRAIVTRHNPELRGMELPAAFIESKKEVIRGKRSIKEYKRNQELDRQSAVFEDAAGIRAG